MNDNDEQPAPPPPRLLVEPEAQEEKILGQPDATKASVEVSGQKERWHVCEHDAGCVMGENDNVIGLAINADNAEHFVKEHNG